MKFRAFVVTNPSAAKRWREARAGGFPASASVARACIIEADTPGAALTAAILDIPGATAANLIVEPIELSDVYETGNGDTIATPRPKAKADPKPPVVEMFNGRTIMSGNTAIPAADCIVYDVETKLCQPDGYRDPQWQYAASRTDYIGMGISVIAAVDTRDLVPRVFLDDNIHAFFKLIEGRCVAGFGNHDFDDIIITAHGATVDRSYDIVRHGRRAFGEPEDYTPNLTRGGRSCNDYARANLEGMQKSAHGSEAPKMYQRGEIGALVDYCLRDAVIETQLILKIPKLIDPRTGRPLSTMQIPR